MTALRKPCALRAIGLRVSVILPCHNEGSAIAEVVRSFQKHLPDAEVHVYDNASTDDTDRAARGAGARVHKEPILGKGSVVRRMFADVDADVYVMADGDGTYDASKAPALVARLVEDELDMVVGLREAKDGAVAFRRGHIWGNRRLNGFLRFLFGSGFEDMLSGYRVFSRRFVKSFPARSTGFEIETELSVHALSLRLPCAEVGTAYFARSEGTRSKLSTVRDGAAIVWTMVLLFKEVKPAWFFGILAVAFGAASLGLGLPVVKEFFETGLVLRFPTAILAASLGLLAAIGSLAGLVLDSVARMRWEMNRMAYLAAGGPAPK